MLCSQKTVTLLDPMDGLARIMYDNNASFCRLGGPSAWLTLWWQPGSNGTIMEPNQRTMSFNFSAVSYSSSGGLVLLCNNIICMHTCRVNKRANNIGRLMLFISTSFSLEWISPTMQTLPVCCIIIIFSSQSL